MVNIKRTFNLFKEPHYKEDEVNLTRGFCSTICFLLSLLIGFSIIAAFLFQQERTFQVKVSTPTLQQYLDIEDFSPTCPCAKSLVQVKDVPALVNFIPSQATKECALDATATCDFISAVFNSVDEQALEAALTSNNQVEAGLGMWVEDVLGTANGFCFTTSSAAARIRSTFFATGVGASTLLNRDEFEDLMVSAVRVTAIDLSNSYSQTSTVRGRPLSTGFRPPLPTPRSLTRARPMQLLQNLASAGRIQQYAASRDLASLPAVQGKSSDNCTCSGDNAMPYCRFQLQIGGVLHDAGCGIPATVLGLQAKALDTTLYQASDLFASKVLHARDKRQLAHASLTPRQCRRPRPPAPNTLSTKGR